MSPQTPAMKDLAIDVNSTKMFVLLPVWILLASHFAATPGWAEEAPTRTEKRYDGATLDEWRERIKNLDPQAPQSAAAVPGLMAIVADRDAPWFSRRQAALTLGRIGRPAADAVPLLLAVMEEDGQGDDAPRLWAVKALALFGPVAKPAVPRLIELLWNEDRPVTERLAPLEALSQIGTAHPDVVPTLIEVLSYRPRAAARVSERAAAEFRELAADAIAYLGPPAGAAVPALIRATRDDVERVRRKAVSALGSMGQTAEIAIPAVVELMVFDESPAVRDAAATALAGIGPAALPVLQHLLNDEDPEVRWRAADAVGKLGADARGAAPALRQLLRDDNSNVRMHAVEALWETTRDARQVVPTLVEGLQSEDRQIRIRSFRQLANLGVEAQLAIEALERLQSDERGYVRHAAKTALEKLREIPK